MSLGKYAELTTETRERLKMVVSPFTPSVVARYRNLGEAEHWVSLFCLWCSGVFSHFSHILMYSFQTLVYLFFFCGVNENNNNKILEEQDEKQLSKLPCLQGRT